MSLGLFDTLTADVENLIFHLLDAQSLQNADLVSASFRSQLRSEQRFRLLLVENYLNFNSIMARDDLRAISTASNPTKPADDDNETHKNYGLHLIRESSIQRTINLIKQGNFHPVGSFNGLSIKLDANQQLLSPVCTWKRLYHAAVSYLDVKTTWELREMCESELVRLALSAPKELASYALKALLTRKLSLDTLKMFKSCSVQYEPWINHLVIEHLCFRCSEWEVSGFVSLLARVGDPISTYLMISEEFNPWNRSLKAEKNVMCPATFEFIRTVGPLRVFCMILRYAGLESGVQPSDQTLEDEIYRVLKMEESTDPGEGLRPILRGMLLLLLHFLGSNSCRIITELFGISSRLPLLQDLMTKLLKPSVQTSADAAELLAGIVCDPERSSADRIHAAWILTDAGIQLDRAWIEKIPNFPRPWDGAIPLPPGIRECILRRYAPTAEDGTDLALRLEAALLGASSGPNEALTDDPEPTEQFLDGICILGPYPAGEIYPQGSGTFNDFKVYIQPHTRHRPDATPYSTLRISACTFGSFARLGRYDGWISNNEDDDAGNPASMAERDEVFTYAGGNRVLPTKEAADKALRKWAKQHEFNIVPAEVLSMTFDGLNVRFFIRKKALKIEDLLFFWQD